MKKEKKESPPNLNPNLSRTDGRTSGIGHGGRRGHVHGRPRHALQVVQGAVEHVDGRRRRARARLDGRRPRRPGLLRPRNLSHHAATHTHTHGCQSDQHPPPTPPSEIGEQRTTCSRASVSVPRLWRASPIGSEAAAPTGGPRAPRSPGKQAAAAAAARPPRTGPGGASPRSSAWSRPSRPARPPREVDGWVGFLSGSRIGGAGRPAAVGGLERNFAAGRERDAGGVGTCGDDESGAGFPFLRLLLPFARRQAGRERG